MADKRKTLRTIKSGVFSRSLALAKISVTAGSKAASHALGGLFSAAKDKPERLKELLYSQAEMLARELGQLKGSLMKVGQMLSVYGEHFLPPEANAFLKSLQNESPPLDWPEIEKVLRRQLKAEKLALLEIDRSPFASASLGQVHRARRKSDGLELALKIQYPGVDRAVESDLKALKRLLGVANLLPGDTNTDELFDEVRTMLHREVDYRKEVESLNFFRQVLSADPRFILPTPVDEFCTPRVVAMTFEEGVAVDSAEVQSLSEERRNALGAAALELYFIELFKEGIVQTDPHFGNYRVRVGSAGNPDRLVLFDFGATRKFSEKFLEPYRRLVRSAVLRDISGLEKASLDLGFTEASDTEELKAAFFELCFLIVEPFSLAEQTGAPQYFDLAGRYDWKHSDLPKRVAAQAFRMKDAIGFKLRVPPREIVFLDRKMGGVFIFLASLGVRLNAREILDRYLGLSHN